MNERIKELAQKAFFDKDTSGPSNQMYTFSDAKMQKFAELIVKECAGIYSAIDNGNLHLGSDDYLEALHKTFFESK